MELNVKCIWGKHICKWGKKKEDIVEYLMFEKLFASL